MLSKYGLTSVKQTFFLNMEVPSIKALVVPVVSPEFSEVIAPSTGSWDFGVDESTSWNTCHLILQVKHCVAQLKWKDLLTVWLHAVTSVGGLLHDTAGKYGVISHYRDTTHAIYRDLFSTIQFFFTTCLFQAAQISHIEPQFKQARSFIPLWLTWQLCI